MKIEVHRHQVRGWERQEPDIYQILVTIPAERPVLGFAHYLDPNGAPDPGGEHRIVFNELTAKQDGTWVNVLVLNGTVFQDKSEDDNFCSDMFHKLTGQYPHTLIETCEGVFEHKGLNEIIWG